MLNNTSNNRTDLSPYLIFLLVLVAALFMLVESSSGQQPGPTTGITLQSGQLQPPQGFSGTAIGQSGGTTIYYWVVAHYTTGIGPSSGPLPVTNTVGIPNLSVSNAVVMSWTAVPNAIGYTVYRSNSPDSPILGNSCASCGVVSNSPVNSVVDSNSTGISLSLPSSVSPSTAEFTVNVTSLYAPFVNVNFRNRNYRLALFGGNYSPGDCIEVASDGSLQSTGVSCGVGGSAYNQIVDESTNLTQRNVLRFAGGGVTCSDDAVNSRTDCSIPGGASNASSLTDFNVTRTSNTVITVNSTASSTTPVVMSCGNTSTQITNPGTVTLTSGTASVNGFLYVNCATGTPVLTFGHNTANTYVGSDVTVATGITGFPTGTVVRPLWIITGTAGVWDPINVVNDRRAVFNTMKQITAGTNVILTESAGQVQISATGGAPFNPLDFTTMYERIYFQRLAYTSVLGSGWSYLGACGGSTSTAPTASDASGVGFSGINCWILHPNNASPQASLPVFLHGATPRPYNTTIRAGKAATSGDIYFGYSSSPSSASTGNFVGVRWSNASSVWQCVIRAANSDVAVQPIAGSVNDANLHTFTISNDSTPNRVQCTFDGGPVTTTSGTIPTYTALYVLLGTPDASTNFFLRSMGYAIQGQNQ